MGRFVFEWGGYTCLQLLSPAHLIRHIAVSKLRIAAKKVLRLTNKAVFKRRRKEQKGTDKVQEWEKIDNKEGEKVWPKESSKDH
jgi:hypothetical protein